MIRRPPRPPRTDPPFPYTTLVRSVRAIAHDGAAVVREPTGGRFAAEKIVLAAGHGIKPLAAMLGMNVPIHPERGQIIVTERLQPLLDLPVGMTRQTNEGSLLLGNSHEHVRSEEHTSEIQSLMRTSYAVFGLKKKKLLHHNTQVNP